MTVCTIYENEKGEELEFHFQNYTRTYFWASLFFFLLMLIILSSIPKDVNANQKYELSDINYQLIKVEENPQYTVNLYNEENILNVYDYESFYDMNVTSNDYLLLCDQSFFSWKNTTELEIKGYVSEHTKITIHFKYSSNYTTGSSYFHNFYSKNDFIENNLSYDYNNFEYFNNWNLGFYYSQSKYFTRFYNDDADEYYSASSSSYTDSFHWVENTYNFNVNENFSINIDILDLSNLYERNDLMNLLFASFNTTTDIKINSVSFFSRDKIFEEIELKDYTIYPNNDFNTFFEFELNDESIGLYGFSYMLENNNIQDIKSYIEYYGFGVFPSWQYDIDEHYLYNDNTLIDSGSGLTFYLYAIDDDIDESIDYNTTFQIYLNPNEIIIRYRYYYNFVDDNGYYYYIANIEISHSKKIKSYFGIYLDKDETFNFLNEKSNKEKSLYENGNLFVLSYDDRGLKTNVLLSKEKEDSLKIKSDWGIFNPIKNGINIIISVMETLVNSLATLFSPVYEVLENIGSLIYAPFASTITTISNNLASIGIDVFAIFEPAITIISNSLTSIYTTLLALPPLVYSAFQAILTNIYNAILNVASEIYTLVEPILTAIFDVLNIFPIISILITHLETIILSVVDIFIWIASSIIDIVSFILTFIIFLIDLSIILIEIYYLIGSLLILMHIGNGRDYSDSLRLMFDYFIRPILLLVQLIQFIVQFATSFIP